MVAPTKPRVNEPMGKARVSKSGQVTIPVEIRKELGLEPGDTVVYNRGEDGRFFFRKPRSAAQLAGILGPRPDDLDEIVEEARHYVRARYRDQG